MLPSSGRRRSRDTAIPDSVLIAVSASAPAASMARAIGRTSATFGDSFTSSGRSVARRTAAVTAPAAARVDRELDPALADVRAADVQLDAGDAGTPSSRRTTST